MCAGKLHKPIKTSRKPMVATTLSRFTKETTRENDRHPLEASASTVNAKHPGLQKIGEINRNSSFNRHVKAELSTDRKNRSTAKVRSSKQECCNQKEVGASNFNGTEQCLISEGLDTDAALNTATTGKIHSGSDVCAMQGSLKNVTRDSCANEFLNSSVQDSAVSLKTLGHPRQNVHAVFSTLPGDRRGYKSGDVVTALQDSPGEKDEFLGNQHPCKHGISSAHSSFPCSHCHNNHSVKDDAHVEGAAPQFKLNADIQDLIHKLENDVRNIKVDVETITKAKTVQEASVQTSPKTSIHFGSSSGSMDALSMYFPSMFPDGSDPVPPPAAAPSINRGNDRLLEDLWQCLHDVQRRQHVLTDNLDMTTHVRHCEELRSLMELLPANPSIFSERMTIKRRVDECTSSVRAEILAAVAEQLNAEKQSRASRHQPANHSLDRGKCVRLGQGRNIPRGNPGTKPAVSSTRTIRGTQKSTSPSKALLPSPMNRTCKLPQHPRPKQPNSNQKLRSDLLWCEDNHRHVYGNLLGLGKQSREIRPYLHLRNPLPSQPVPWPPSSTHKTSSVASKELACFSSAHQLSSPMQATFFSCLPHALLKFQNYSSSSRMHHSCINKIKNKGNSCNVKIADLEKSDKLQSPERGNTFVSRRARDDGDKSKNNSETYESSLKKEPCEPAHSNQMDDFCTNLPTAKDLTTLTNLPSTENAKTEFIVCENCKKIINRNTCNSLQNCRNKLKNKSSVTDHDQFSDQGDALANQLSRQFSAAFQLGCTKCKITKCDDRAVTLMSKHVRTHDAVRMSEITPLCDKYKADTPQNAKFVASNSSEDQTYFNISNNEVCGTINNYLDQIINETQQLTLTQLSQKKNLCITDLSRSVTNGVTGQQHIRDGGVIERHKQLYIDNASVDNDMLCIEKLLDLSDSGSVNLHHAMKANIYKSPSIKLHYCKSLSSIGQSDELVGHSSFKSCPVHSSQLLQVSQSHNRRLLLTAANDGSFERKELNSFDLAELPTEPLLNCRNQSAVLKTDAKQQRHKNEDMVVKKMLSDVMDTNSNTYCKQSICRKLSFSSSDADISPNCTDGNALLKTQPILVNKAYSPYQKSVYNYSNSFEKRMSSELTEAVKNIEDFVSKNTKPHDYKNGNAGDKDFTVAPEFEPEVAFKELGECSKLSGIPNLLVSLSSPLSSNKYKTMDSQLTEIPVGRKWAAITSQNTAVLSNATVSRSEIQRTEENLVVPCTVPFLLDTEVYHIQKHSAEKIEPTNITLAGNAARNACELMNVSLDCSSTESCLLNTQMCPLQENMAPRNAALTRSKLSGTYAEAVDLFAAGDNPSNLKLFPNRKTTSIDLLKNVMLSPSNNDYSYDATSIKDIMWGFDRHCFKKKRNVNSDCIYNSLTGVNRKSVDASFDVNNCKVPESGDWFSYEAAAARHLKHNPISQAFGLSLSQKSQVTSNRINELNTTSVTDRLAGVDKEVKKMKPSVTFLDPSPNSSVSLESTNKMLGSSQKLNTSENSMDLLESDSQNSTIDHELGKMITNDSLDTHAETVEEDTANPVINGEGSDESVTSDESAVDSINKDSNSMNPTASPPSGFLEATDVSVTENAGCNDREDCSELLAAVSSKEDNSQVAQQVIDEDLKEQPQEGVTALSSNVDALKMLIDATDMLMITSEAIANSIATHHENNYVADARHLQAPSPVAANSSIVIKPMSSLNTRDLQARSAPPTNLSVPKQQSSSEQYLNEAKYWIEQELLARSLSLLLPVQEVTRPALSLQQPNTEPPSFVDLSEIPDKESWLINIIGDEGVKLFQEADTPVDTELVCQLIQDVISEQAITRVLALRKTSKQEDSGSEASLEPPSESYSKDTFVSESGSDVAAENEVLHEEDLVKKPQMVESLPTPIVTPLGSPKNSKTVQEAEIETEFPLQLTAPFYNFPDDRPVTPLLSESASESEEKEERLLGGGLLLPESDPMHPDSENPSNPAGTPPTSPPPQTLNQSTSVHEQINPPTTPQLSAATESSLASLATGGHMEQASVWNQGTQTTPRRMVPENRYQADDQPTLSNANASVLNILPRQTVSTVDQGVGTSPPSSHGRVNGEIEFPEADFDLSEGEWLMYQRQIRRMLPAARNAAQGSSQTFNLSHGSGSMDNTLRDSEELELDPLSEGEIPFSFSPEWLSSILSLIAELQSSGQVPGQSLSNDAAFITAARNLVSGSTSRLPSPGEITSPRALSRQHLRQPLRLSTAGRVTSHITSNPAFTPGDPTQPAYTQHLLSTSVTVITDSSSDSTQGNEASESNVVAYEPAEPVFVTESQPVDDRRTRCPRVSEGEVRPSVVPTLGHQSEPLHNSSPMVTVPFNLLKRSSSTPAVSSSSISQRRFVGGIPAARTQVAAEVKVTSTVSPTLVTPVTTVSQPLISHRSSVNNHVDRENIEIATEPFLIMEGFPVQQRGQSETVTSVNTVSERESQVHDSPVYKLTAAREEIALSLPKEESLMVRLTNALDDRARASNTTDTNSVNLQNGRSEEGITCSRTNVKDIQEVTNKSCSSPGQVSSPIASSPLAETRSASTSISEGEARLN